MNRSDLLDALEARGLTRRQAADAVAAVFDVIIREVAAGGKVGITGFGTFERFERAARTGRNPHTGDSVRIDATPIPKFRPGTAFMMHVADPSTLPLGVSAGGRAPAGADIPPVGARLKQARVARSNVKRAS